MEAMKRNMMGLPADLPSQMKVMAWSMVKIARVTLAEAFEEKKNPEAIELYISLVEHCKRARVEIWEGEVELHRIMSNLALCCKRLGRYEEAADWYTKADQLCVTEAPDSEVHRQIKKNIAVMMEGKAGGFTLGNDGSTKKPWKRCWGCNAIESEEVKMMKCKRCGEYKLATPARYCSRQCQIDYWPRHGAYHKSMKKRLKESKSNFKEEDLAVLLSEGTIDDDSYEGVLRKAAKCQVQNDEKSAMHLYKKAIKIDPNNPLAHHNLATLYGHSGHYSGAIKEFTETILLIETGGLHEPYMELWARSVATTHALYRDRGGSLLSIEKPKFLTNDEVMLKCAEQASKLVPTYNECWAMLAAASEKMGDLGKSKEFYKKAAEVSEKRGNKEKFAREANRVGGLL